MTPSRGGNGCENGKWSRENGRLHYCLYFHACGFYSVIQEDVHGEGVCWTFFSPGPPFCTFPRAAFCIRVPLNCAPWGAGLALPHPSGPAANPLWIKVVRDLQKPAPVRLSICTFHVIGVVCPLHPRLGLWFVIRHWDTEWPTRAATWDHK